MNTDKLLDFFDALVAMAGDYEMEYNTSQMIDEIVKRIKEYEPVPDNPPTITN